MQVDDPEEAQRIRAKGGKVIEDGSRVVSPTGRHTLNMSRALGGAPPSRLSASAAPSDDRSLAPVATTSGNAGTFTDVYQWCQVKPRRDLLQGSSRRGAVLMRAPQLGQSHRCTSCGHHVHRFNSTMRCLHMPPNRFD